MVRRDRSDGVQNADGRRTRFRRTTAPAAREGLAKAAVELRDCCRSRSSTYRQMFWATKRKCERRNEAIASLAFAPCIQYFDDATESVVRSGQLARPRLRPALGCSRLMLRARHFTRHTSTKSWFTESCGAALPVRVDYFFIRCPLRPPPCW
jgi:hypothetical protein